MLMIAYPTPKKGRFQIKIDRTIEVNISVDEARRHCNAWLARDVSMLFIAQTPDLVVEEQKAVWRLPIMYTAPHVGIVGRIGQIDVDTTTGKRLLVEGQIDAMIIEAEKLAQTVPPFQSITISPDQIPPQHLRAPLATPIE